MSTPSSPISNLHLRPLGPVFNVQPPYVPAPLQAKMILNEMLMNVVMPFFHPFNAKYSATAPQKRKHKPPHAAISRCSLLSTCEGVTIYKHLLLGCGNAGMFHPVLLNLPFTPQTTEQYHIPDFCSHWQKTSDWSS